MCASMNSCTLRCRPFTLSEYAKSTGESSFRDPQSFPGVPAARKSRPGACEPREGGEREEIEDRPHGPLVAWQWQDHAVDDDRGSEDQVEELDRPGAAVVPPSAHREDGADEDERHDEIVE